jgi:5'-nucleotidase
MIPMPMPRLILALWIAIATGCASVAPPEPVRLRLIAFNDFHGHLETPSLGVVVADASAAQRRGRMPAGGVAHLATAIRELKSGQAHTVVVAAGDLISASPPVSSLFLDEPAVNALSAAGLELTSVGNHDFDRGREELERLQRGGCSTPDSCFDGRFPGAGFQYLAANVIETATGKPLFPPYAIRSYGGVPVAFVGAVLRGTPQIVSASGIRGLAFLDEAQSVNALVPELRAKGVEAIVLLIHEGGRSSGAYDDPACPRFEGAILGVVRRLDRAVDIVVSGHTHEAYVCRVDGRLVTSAGSYGRFVTTIDLGLDPLSRDVVEARATNIIVDPQKFVADPRLDAYVRRVADRAKDRLSRVIGTIEGEFTPVASTAGESNLGNLVADSQLAAMREPAGAEVAFMNPGGMRASLMSTRPDRAVTFGDVYSVQPFGNTLVAMTLTGTQILRLLEQQWRSAAPGVRPRLLQVSEGFRYAWDASKRVGARIVPGSVAIAGRPLEEAARYRVVVNSFLAGGGDGFTVLTEGIDVTGGPLDIDAFESHLRGRTRVARPPEGRITRK